MRKLSMIEQAEGTCFLCTCIYNDWSRKNSLHRHHIFYGCRHDKAEKYKLTINLCPYHHTGDINGNSEAIHHNHEIDMRIKAFAQFIFERTYSRELFVKEFGKSWL